MLGNIIIIITAYIIGWGQGYHDRNTLPDDVSLDELCERAKASRKPPA